MGKAYRNAFYFFHIKVLQVSFNIMWTYLEQNSFPLNEHQLMEKYDRFAILINSWDQANKVSLHSSIRSHEEFAP